VSRKRAAESADWDVIKVGLEPGTARDSSPEEVSSIVASSLCCQPRRSEMSCAQLYAAPNGARKSRSASVTINITPTGLPGGTLDSPL
jgi:hypothetical protein